MPMHILPKKNEAAVRGVVLPGPRFTKWAWLYMALYIFLPIIGAAFLLDLILYFVFRDHFGVCYAVLCFF